MFWSPLQQIYSLPFDLRTYIYFLLTADAVFFTNPATSDIENRISNDCLNIEARVENAFVRVLYHLSASINI